MPFDDAFEAMKYLQVDDSALQSVYRADPIPSDALQAVIVAIANKLEALEQRLDAGQ